uniref:Ras-GAP domain-containing protein n=1 Tax=Angiostrongylus cantonensis TaxID=6313 RepID=A0A0K0DJS6_ANGCA
MMLMFSLLNSLGAQRLFLSVVKGFSAYDSLPPAHAAMVYDRFQHHLVKRAESEFYECMLENIELFVNIVRKNREQFVNDDFTVCEGEVERIKAVLQDDFRFRQLSRLFELRDTLIRRFITLLVQHSLSACPAFSKCAELAIRDAITLFFQNATYLLTVSMLRKKQLNIDASHLVEISVHGEVAIVAQFIMDMKVLLRNEPFQFDNGPAMIRFYDANEITVHKSHDQTLLFLLERRMLPTPVEETVYNWADGGHVHEKQNCFSSPSTECLRMVQLCVSGSERQHDRRHSSITEQMGTNGLKSFQNSK